MKAVILARVSTEEQKDAGNSLPAQTARIEKYCKQKGFEIAETFSFDESAYKNKRREFDKILEYIDSSKEKIAVCFDKVDRMSRNVFDKRVSILYEKAVVGSIELHFVSDNQVINAEMSAVEKFHFGMSLGLAKYYSDAIGDNVKRAFEIKRRRGEWTGRPRIGYINTVDENGKKDIVPDPQRAHLIQKLFELYATDTYSIKTLRTEMVKLGLRNPDGNEPAISNIEKILNDTFYYGIANSERHGKYEHRYKPLIIKDLFDKCQSIRKGRKQNVIFKSRDFIFKGLLHCKNCGCLITAEIKKGKFVYYSCTNAKHICKRVYIPEKELLKPVYEVLDAFQNITEEMQKKVVNELKQVNEAEVAFHDKEIKRIQSEYNLTQAKLDNLLNLLIDKSITKTDYDKKFEELKDKQSRLGVELEEYTQADYNYKNTVSTILNISRRARDIFDSSETYEKRAFIGFLLQNPFVEGKKLVFSLKKPWDVVLQLATTTRWLGDKDSNLDSQDQNLESYH